MRALSLWPKDEAILKYVLTCSRLRMQSSRKAICHAGSSRCATDESNDVLVVVSADTGKGEFGSCMRVIPNVVFAALGGVGWFDS